MNDVFVLEVKPSKTHQILLLLMVLFVLIAVFLSAFPPIQTLVLFVIVVIFAVLSFKKIKQNKVIKFILQKDKQQIFFNNAKTITTTTLTYTYLSNYLTVLKYNKMHFVLFHDSCVNHPLTYFNIFLKTNALCRR